VRWFLRKEEFMGKLARGRVRAISKLLSPFLAALSKPQRAQALVYLAGLIFVEKFRSICEIAAFCGNGHTDRLHHLLSKAPLSAVSLQQSMHAPLASLSADQSAVLALDDTHDPRNGSAIEGAGWHHDGQQLIKGLCAVTAMLKLGTRRFCFAIRGYCSKASCPQDAFRSKIDLAGDILKEAAAHFGRGELVVLADCWYGCVRLLTDIHARGWTYVFGIKSNRIVRVNGKKRRVRDLAKARHKFVTLKLGGRKLRVARVVVELPRVGEVALLMSRCGKEWRFFVSNNLKLGASTLAKLYAHRWGVDVMHREMKQHLGFGEVFARRWQAVQMHWTLVALSYNVVELSDTGGRKSFRAKQRALRAALTPAELIRNYRHHA
jgi:hypothetical protein